MESTLRRTWAEIDLDALAHNYETLRRRIGAGVKFLGVVKADAYGHGAIQVSRKLEQLGADYLAVSSLDEAKELRRAGIQAPILILGHTPPAMVSQLIQYRITQAVSALAKAEAYSAAAVESGGTLKVHIKVDTGMSRLGYLCDGSHFDGGVEGICEACGLPGLEAEGIFTHFAVADEQDQESQAYTRRQFDLFCRVIRAVEEKRGVRFPLRHCANTGATACYPEMHLDMVRPGLLLYGYGEFAQGLDLRPVMTLKTTISKSYLDVVVDAIFRGANDLSQQLSQEDPVGSVQGLLGQTRSLLRSCAKTIDAFQAAGQDNSSYRQDLSDLVSNINQNRPDGQEILDTVAQLNRKVHAALDKAQTALDKAFDAAEKFLNGIDVDAQLPEIQENLRDAAQTMDDMGDRLMAWAKSVAVEAGPVGAEAAAAAQRLADSCYQLRDQLNTLADGLKENSALLQDTIALAAQLEKLADTLLTPVFDDVVNDVKNVLDQSEDLLQGFHGTAADTRDLLAAASAAAGTLDGLMSQGRTAMGQAIDKLGSLLGGLEDSDSPDYLDTLLDILGGNPEDYGAYFSQMVQTSVEPVYPIDNYGSAMAPFYSVLAIWVGGVMLVAILKPHARREGLVAPKPYQLFFGRYFLFFVLSQIQAAIIVAGDLLVLKIQCVEPALLFATGAITSLVFSLLIYSLTISFGDVGKAIVVVVMVLQIAGSSGTFPIELLPDVYQKIYHIFPFPYAIDAMRECICGLYGLTWLKNIGCLLIFGVAALLIGLWVRKPFMGLNHFMEEKLEETEML